MKRVVYYARVSTEEEQQASALVTQCLENEEFITTKEDQTCVDKYIDEGKSGTTIDGRLEFKRMLNDMESDKFDIILIKQIDRGWRNLGDWKIFEHKLIQCNVQLFIRLKNDFYNIEDDGSYISTTMDNMFSEQYSRSLSKKLNAAHKTRMKKGTVVTNGKMWGYNQVDANLVINEEEAEIVRYVFDTYITGKGFRTISNELIEMGVKNRVGGGFALTTLKRMIRNEKYKGTLICGKTHMNFFTKKKEPVPKENWIIHEDKVPAIVSKETWEKANQILQSKKRKYNMDKQAGYFQGTYPLSSKIKCSLCGKKYYHNVYNVTSGKYGVWQCSTYTSRGRNENGCMNIVLREDEVDDIVKKIMFSMWEDKDDQIEEVIKVLEATIEDSKMDSEFEKLDKAIKKLERNKDKIYNLYVEEIISKQEFKERNNPINEKLLEYRNKYQLLKKEEVGRRNKDERMKKIKDFLNQDLKTIDSVTDSMMKDMVDEIIVYPDRKLDITLNGNLFPSVSDTRLQGYEATV